MPTEITQPEHIDLLHLTAQLRANGLTLNLRSPVFEDYFRTIASNGTATPAISRESDRYQGTSYYVIQNSAFSDFTSGIVTEWGSRQLINGSRPNISVLRAVGLGTGVEITIPTVISRKQKQEFLERFEAAALDFYSQYIRPEIYELVIRVERTTEAQT